MTVLITGAGLLGIETAKLLKNNGVPVVLVDVFAPEIANFDFPFVQADIVDSHKMEQIVEQYEVTRIVHTAALLSSALRKDPVLGLHVNILGSAVLFELCRKYSIQRLVNISSATVLYSGFSTFGPESIPEDAALHLISQKPSSLYALTKISVEQLGLLYRDMYGIDVVSLRLGAVIGGRTDSPTSVPGRLFNLLVSAARNHQYIEIDDPYLVWSGKEEFVDVRDCALAVVDALQAETPRLGVYNIVHPTGWTLDETIQAVAQIHGTFHADYDRSVTTGFAGFPCVRPASTSTTAAQEELGFRARHDLLSSLSYWW